jgi:hypothetical protein
VTTTTDLIDAKVDLLAISSQTLQSITLDDTISVTFSNMLVDIKTGYMIKLVCVYKEM